MLVGVGFGQDGGGPGRCFLFRLVPGKVGLFLRLIGCGAGVGILIAGDQRQGDAIGLCRRGHAAVLLRGLRFQLGARLVGGIQRGRRFLVKGQIGVHQHKARIVGIKEVAGAVVGAGGKGLGPVGTVQVGQQPEDALGQQEHHQGAPGQKQPPVAGQAQLFAALPFTVGQGLGLLRPGRGAFLFHPAALLLFGPICSAQRRTDTAFIIHPFAFCVNAGSVK